MDELADLKKKDFEECKGQVFRIAVESDEIDDDFSLQLCQVEPLKSENEKRESFSVVFKGPKQPVLQQAAIPLRNESLGEVTIFLVPVGQDKESTIYEAVFN
ncbi:MAG TPA: hypothetical protein VLV83_23180 [Acidobacteriota bacterium]|nr:hypothetical protein [Acidobacteriota bacterium]